MPTCKLSSDFYLALFLNLFVEPLELMHLYNDCNIQYDNIEKKMNESKV